MAEIIPFPTRKAAEENKRTDLISKIIVSPVNSPYVKDLDSDILSLVKIEATGMNYPEAGTMVYKSLARETIYESFGIQSSQEFLMVEFYKHTPRSENTEMLDGLEQLSHYVNAHFPQVPCELMRLVYAVVGTILEYPGARLLATSSVDSCFCFFINVENAIEKFSLLVRFKMQTFLWEYLAYQHHCEKEKT